MGDDSLRADSSVRLGLKWKRWLWALSIFLVLVAVPHSALAENWHVFQISAPMERAGHEFALRLGANPHGSARSLGISDRLSGNLIAPATVLSVTLDANASESFTLLDMTTGEQARLSTWYGGFWAPEVMSGLHLGNVSEGMFVAPTGGPVWRSLLIPEARIHHPLALVQPGGVVSIVVVQAERVLPYSDSTTHATYSFYEGRAGYDRLQPFWIVDLEAGEYAAVGVTDVTSCTWLPVGSEMNLRRGNGEVVVVNESVLSPDESYYYTAVSGRANASLPWYSQDIHFDDRNGGSPGGNTMVVNLYVLPGGAGLRDGSDWANAMPRVPILAPRNSIIWLGDGDYEGYQGATENDGAKTITIMKATAAAHGTSIGWNPSFGVGVATFPIVILTSDYWTFDGAKRDNLQTGHGIKIEDSTHDNASLFWLDNEHSGRKHITLRYVEMAGDPTLAIRTTGFYGNGYSGNDGTGPFVFYRCSFHDLWGVAVAANRATSVLFDESWMANTRSTSATIPPALEPWHTEGFQLRRSSDVEIRRSVFKNIDGTAIFRDGGGGASANWNIHHNVIDMTGNQTVAHVLSFNDGLTDSIDGVRFTDNIIFGQHGNGSAGFWWGNSVGSITVKGNVWYDCVWIPLGATWLITERGYNYFSDTAMPYANLPMMATEGTFHESFDLRKLGSASDTSDLPFLNPDFATSGDYTLVPAVEVLITYP